MERSNATPIAEEEADEASFGAEPFRPQQPPAGPRRLLITAAVVLIVGGAGAIVRVPVHSIGPGPARDVLGLIQVEGVETYPSTGQLLLTTATVSGSPLNLWELVWSWADPNLGTTARRNVVHPGTTDREQSARNVFDMEQSKLLAELAAFEVLGTPASPVRGARVISVIEEGPAHGVLEPRDVLLTVHGQPVDGPGDVLAALRGVEVGDEIVVTLRRDGQRRTERLTTGAAADDADRAVIGVFIGEAYRLPHDVEIDTERIGGPSGGLVFALAIIDVLSADDLTRGHVIAATGTIGDDLGEDGTATIGVIGAVAEKVRAARSSGATVFMLPAVEADEARALAPDDMIVVGVATLGEAIEALRALPERDAA